MRPRTRRPWALIGVLIVIGCGESDTAAPNMVGTELLSVVPAGGSTGVSVTTQGTMTFSGAMQSGMEQYVDLHHGDASGPIVPMACTWSTDRRTVTCTPSQPLDSGTTYTMHMGGGMMDADGHPVDMQSHQTANGGEWLMPTMMAGMHGGMPMGGMGSGWKGTNGSYGMLFQFTTCATPGTQFCGSIRGSVRHQRESLHRLPDNREAGYLPAVPY